MPLTKDLYRTGASKLFHPRVTKVISYYTTVRGSDILRNVIVSGYVTFFQIKKFSSIYFSLFTKCVRGPHLARGRWLETHGIEEWAQRIEVNDDEHSLFMALRLGYCYV